MREKSKAVAYPGLPVIFAEGFRDYRRRLSAHSHASFAVTDAYETVKTETSAEAIEYGVEFTLNGETPSDVRGQSASELILEMSKMAVEQTGVRVDSVNHNIVTGSSDSGAAALVTCLDDLLGLNLPLWQMNEFAMKVSETAYRSLLGGLTEYVVDESGEVNVRKLKDAKAFKDVNIYAIPFNIKRFTADDLHKRVTQHPHFGLRNAQVDIRLRDLRRHADDANIVGILETMEAEAKSVHRLFSEMGMEVIKGEMQELVDMVQDMRARGLSTYWNVAGGSQVYVFTLKTYAKQVARELKDTGHRYKHYKIAEGARVV